MRVFCQEKCVIAIRNIISLCEKNVNLKILVSDNPGFYVMIEKEKPLVTHDHVHELKQGHLSVAVASVWVATGQLINATLRHPFCSVTVECTEKLCDVISTVYCQVQSSCSFVSGGKQMRFVSFVCFLVTLMHSNTKPFSPACLL